MRDDIKLLFSNKRYVSMTTLIVCCMDALAGYPGKADKRKFVSFVSTHFRDLDAELGALFPGKAGALTFYELFRNGFAHVRAPNGGCAIAEEWELPGQWAGKIDVGGVLRNAVNVDRIAHQFLALVNRLAPAGVVPPTV